MVNIATLNKISSVGLERFPASYRIMPGEDGLQDAVGVIVRSYAMHDMDIHPELLAVARAGAGVNNIPTDRLADAGVVVFNTPGANANAVKELVIGGLINAARNVPAASAWVTSLSPSPDIAKAVEKGKSQFKGTEIMGKTLGVVGLGAVGLQVANAAHALGMNVCGYDPYLSLPSALHLDPAVTVYDKLEDMLPGTDYVSLHLPALPSTRGMFSSALFSSFKEGAVLLNYSRDTLICEADLLSALQQGRLRRYVTDFATPAIMGREDVLITPHLGASTKEAEDTCAIMAADQMKAYLEDGNILHSVNYPDLDLGPRGQACRVAILTKGIEDPGKRLAEMMKKGKVSRLEGRTRKEYGYALCQTDEPVADLPQGKGILRIRIIR